MIPEARKLWIFILNRERISNKQKQQKTTSLRQRSRRTRAIGMGSCQNFLSLAGCIFTQLEDDREKEESCFVYVCVGILASNWLLVHTRAYMQKCHCVRFISGFS